MRPDTEPTIRLQSGAMVLRAVYDGVVELVATGHAIDTDGDGVRIDPPVHEDALAILETCSQDTAAVLADLEAVARRIRAARRMLH